MHSIMGNWWIATLTAKFKFKICWFRKNVKRSDIYYAKKYDIKKSNFFYQEKATLKLNTFLPAKIWHFIRRENTAENS